MEKALQESLDKIHQKLEEHSEILGEHSKILGEHTKILGEHSKLLGEHSTKFDQLLEREDLLAAKIIEHDEKFLSVETKLVQHDQNFDKIFKKLIEHDQRFERIEEQLDQTLTKQEFATAADKIMGMLQDMKQEMIITHHDLSRTEQRVDEHDQAINSINLKLGLA
jgi:chromosome segregation ATPase